MVLSTPEPTVHKDQYKPTIDNLNKVPKLRPLSTPLMNSSAFDGENMVWLYGAVVALFLLGVLTGAALW